MQSRIQPALVTRQSTTALPCSLGGADGAADPGVSEAVYLHDPDGNGIELYWDRPREEWPTDAEGHVVMRTEPLDLGAVLAEGAQQT